MILLRFMFWCFNLLNFERQTEYKTDYKQKILTKTSIFETAIKSHSHYNPKQSQPSYYKTKSFSESIKERVYTDYFLQFICPQPKAALEKIKSDNQVEKSMSVEQTINLS